MGFDISKLTGADGKPVSLEGVDAKVVTLLGALGTALESAMGEGMKTAVAEALEPVTAKIAEIEKKPADPKPDPKQGDPKQEDEPPAWFKAHAEKVDKLVADREAEKTQGSVTQMVRAHLDAKYPNLSKEARPIIEARLIAAAPKDEAALKAGIDTIRKEYTAFGGDAAKVFDADPESEGAKTDPKDEAEREKAEKLKLIREAGPLTKTA